MPALSVVIADDPGIVIVYSSDDDIEATLGYADSPITPGKQPEWWFQIPFFIIVGVDAADCKRKFIGWFRDFVKGKAGGDTCIVKDINGQAQPELYHHIMDAELHMIEGDLSGMANWNTQCRAGIVTW